MIKELDFNKIDVPLHKLIKLMNEKGFETEYCCASKYLDGHTSNFPSANLYISFTGDIKKLAPLVSINTKYTTHAEAYPDYYFRWQIIFSGLSAYKNEPLFVMDFFPLLYKFPKKEVIPEICLKLIQIAENFFENLG